MKNTNPIINNATNPIMFEIASSSVSAEVPPSTSPPNIVRIPKAKTVALIPNPIFLPLPMSLGNSLII